MVIENLAFVFFIIVFLYYSVACVVNTVIFISDHPDYPSVKFVTFLFRNPSCDGIMKSGLLAMWPGRITEKVPYGGNDDA